MAASSPSVQTAQQRGPNRTAVLLTVHQKMPVARNVTCAVTDVLAYEMEKAARELDFPLAAKFRDELLAVEKMITEKA